jgi:hypothetical protein
LILHRLTPKLTSENGQVGPHVGPQNIFGRRRFANSS